MVYTSKTLIPGKTPIGQNRDGSYIYDGVQTKNMSVMPSRGTYDTTKQMSVAPKPIYTTPSVLPMTKSPIGFNIMPQVNKEIAQKVNAPVKDTLNFRTKIVEDSPRVQQLRQHFRALEQKGEFQLNDKQTEYIRKFKAKYPDYANVPDVSLYSKIILAEPKAMEQYGNIGKKGIIESIAGLPLAMAKTGSDAIMEAQDVFQERQKTLNKEGNLGLTNLLAGASAGRALGTGVLGMAGDVLNVASPLINPETGVTSVAEGLTRDLGTMVEKVPEEYRQEISDLMKKYPKISASLGTAFDLSNLIPFLGVLGKAKSAGQVDDIIKTVKARPATRFRGEVSPTAFEAGMNRSLVSDTLNIPKNVVKITPNPLNVLKRSPEKALAKNIERLQEVSINKGTRNILKRAEAKGFNPLDDVARYDDLRPEVIDGKLNTEKGIVRLSDEIDKNADILSKAIKAEGRKVSVDSAYKRMLDNIKDDLGEGLNYESAIKRAKTAFRTLKRNADEKGLVALEQLDAMKKKIYKETNYLKDTDFADKAIARALKEAVEDGTLSADVKALNNELSKGYTTINYLESIQGRAVKGGRLGNAFARVGGQVAGSALGGWVGALAGGEVAARIQNQMIKNIFKVTGKQAEKSSMFKGLNKTPIGLPPKTELKLLPPGKPIQKAMESTIITEPKVGQIKATSSSLPSGTSEVSSIQKLLPMPQKPQKTPGKSSVLNQLSKGKEKSAGKKVNTIIQKLAKKQETPKTPEDWTKKDFTKATETKSVDKFGNTIAREQGKTSAIDSITVGGKKYTNLDIPDSSRELYELDGKVYEYKNGKMIPEGAKTPQVEGKTAMEAKLDATINKKLIEEAKKHTDFVDFFQSKLGDKQPTKDNLMKLGFSAEDIARNTDSLGISLEDLFYEIKTGKLSSYPAKQPLPLSQKSEVKYSKPIDKTTLPVEIRNLPLTDRIPGNELKIKPGTGEIYFEGKKIKEFDTGKEAMDWIYAIEDNPEYQKFIKVKKDAVTAGKQNITDTLIKKSKSFDDITKSSQIKDTVFHGTPNKDFIQFKLGKKSNTGTVDAGEAIWFTNSKEGADYWSNYSKDGGRTLEVKILSKNMAEVSGDEIGGQFGMLNTIEQAKNEGYDGLIIDQGAGEKWYAVFDPENAVTKQYYDKVKANKK